MRFITLITLLVAAPLLIAAPDALEPVAAPMPEVRLGAETGPDNLIWVEGETAVRSTAIPHSWYDSVRKEELSGNAWLSHFDDAPAEAAYEVKIPTTGRYHFWLRANPVGSPQMAYRIGEGSWTDVDFSNPVQQINIAQDGQPDLRFIAWIALGEIQLEQGQQTITFKLTSTNKNHGAIDAFILSSTSFSPNYSLRPGEASGRVEKGKWAFEPAPDTFNPDALLDLSYLNEKPAGRGGFICTSKDGESFVDGRGNPIRFWSGTTYVASDKAPVEDIGRHARFYAKRGINMVRYHGDLAPQGGKDFGSVNRNALDEIWRLVAGMKQWGIYTTISPYWGSHTKWQSGWDLPNPDGPSMTGLLFFEPKTQEAYKNWLRALFTEPNPYTGVALKDDPAFAIFQIQNEDSLLFWTSQQIKGAALGLWRQQHAAWLTQKYGTLEKAQEHWRGEKHEDDNFEAGEAGLFTVWHLTREQTGGRALRMADQVEFMTTTMRNFNSMIAAFIRDDLGAPQLINAGNWRTADNARLLDAERWSYTANEVIAANNYFNAPHQGEKAGYAILKGDIYQSRSALKNPLSLPVNVKQPTGHPFLISESQWVPPNLYQSEGPLAVAAYQSLTGVDSFYWFTLQRGFQPPFAKWDTSTPMQMGMFPAAALMFRNGYVQEGEPVVVEERTLQDLWNQKVPALVEQQGFDPNRDAKPVDPASGVSTQVDPRAFLAGPVRVRYGVSKARTQVRDLKDYIDPGKGIVRSVTNEIALNHRLGVLVVDTLKAQAAAGFLRDASPIQMRDVEIEVRNPYGAIQVVSLDGKDLGVSGHILVQAGTTARPYGFEDKAATLKDGDENITAREITALGSFPWNLEENDFEIILRNTSISKAWVLDANGVATREIPLKQLNDTRRFTFPPDALYVVLR